MLHYRKVARCLILLLQLEVMSRQDLIGLEDLDEEVSWLNDYYDDQKKGEKSVSNRVKRQGWDSNPRVQSTMD